MALRAVASVFAPDASKCFAGCEGKLDYQDLIVTKCSHIFCKECLEAWFKKAKHTCPLDQKALIPITADNVRSKEEDAKIDENSVKGMQYSCLHLYIEQFAYYIKNDFPSLQDKLAAANILRISSCQILKEGQAKKKPDQKESDDSADSCSICTEPFPQMYFITRDKDPSKIGHFMHEGCWQATVDNESVILDISVRDMVKIAGQLPPPRELPPEPVTPASPIKVVFIIIVLPVSMWALAMNSRVYHNKSFILYVLSIPAMIIFMVLSFILNGIKAVFTDKRA